MSASEYQAERAIVVLKRWIDAAENSNQHGEDMVVCAAAGPGLLEALKSARKTLAAGLIFNAGGLFDETSVGQHVVIAQIDAAISKAEGQS